MSLFWVSMSQVRDNDHESQITLHIRLSQFTIASATQLEIFLVTLLQLQIM